ncbi:hypothetical protein SLEP1_g22033 [Rubroshorea leprosula]|uniref:Uncharacterized protein n=1 Tax=Rubroshorea leprosula TaxID=152421 RepID=A0AAV5JDX5_9ROSI|nr:hypothetical protein SLEP1_g22033 [Rubroshorea leprosula]
MLLWISIKPSQISEEKRLLLDDPSFLCANSSDLASFLTLFIRLIINP